MRLSNNFAYHVVYILLLPTFFASFCFLYNPFAVQDFYTVGGKTYSFHFVMLFCILIGCLLLSRLILYFVNRRWPVTEINYYIWCFLEMVWSTFFIALYTTLFYRGELPYFSAFSHCFMILGCTLVYPYFILILLKKNANLREDIARQKDMDDNSLIKFYDEHHQLKMTIAPSAVIYISAEANYVKIHYLENDKVKDYMLRNSMKNIEQNVLSHSIVRCHRSYFVNPKFIKVLSRNSSDGLITAEMMEDSRIKVPVSKKYFENLSKIL